MDELTRSTTSSSPGEPKNVRDRNSVPSNQARIVTTHAERSSTAIQPAQQRSSERLATVATRVRRASRTRVVRDAGAYAAATEPRSAGTRVELLSGFDVSVEGQSLDLTFNAQRLVAFLALRERPQPRSAVAGSLWIDSSERRASANLRTTLWKLRTARRGLISVRGNLLGLESGVVVDFTLVVESARRLLHPARDAFADPSEVPGLAMLLTGDLLPEWDEDWILFERERLRQLRVHAIEAMSRQLCNAGRHAEAVDAGLAAVAADALRESAHRVVIEAYLGEGNVADARRQFESFRRVLWDSLGLEPSIELRRLVGVLGPDRTDH